MRRLKLGAIAALTLIIFGAVAAVASAEVDGPPEILLLAGKIAELEYKDSGSTTSTFETVGGTAITIGKHKCVETGYTNDPTATLDANLGILVCDYEEYKAKGVNCRSETAAKVKDPIGTVLVLYDTHLVAERTADSVLEPLLIHLILGIEHETELTINCGGVLGKLKGKFGCLLLPGLTNVAAGGVIEELCKQKGGKPETGTCIEVVSFCEGLAKEPLEINLTGKFEAAALAAHLVGSFNRDVYIDD